MASSNMMVLAICLVAVFAQAAAFTPMEAPTYGPEMAPGGAPTYTPEPPMYAPEHTPHDEPTMAPEMAPASTPIAPGPEVMTPGPSPVESGAARNAVSAVAVAFAGFAALLLQ